MIADYVIVGGGTAGCAMAGRLARSSDCRVLVLEEGPDSKVRAPTLPGILASIHRHSTLHRTPQIPGLHHRSLLIPQARVLGGGSSINAMICVRAHPATYDHWRSLGCFGWGYSDVLPFFRRVENFDDGASTYHGSEGPVDVGKLRWVAPFSSAFVAACVEIGIDRSPDFNGENPSGAGLYHVFQRRSVRSSATSCLSQTERQASIQVKTGVKALRVLFEAGRAVGVEFLSGQKVERCRAEREVIVSCGAIGSPHLLMLSGIGPAEQLSDVGIQVVADVPAVGQNLQDHVRVPTIFHSTREAPLPALPLTFRDGMRFAAAYVRYYLDRNGPMSSQNCEAGAFVQTRSDLDWPDIQFVTHWLDHDLEPCLVAAQSRGQITLRSSDPTVPPVWEPNLLAEQSDVQALTEALKIARGIAHSRELQEYGIAKEVSPGAECQTAKQLERYVRNSADTCFHPAGTCRMGSPDDRRAVVDPELRVRGVDGLRVADVSIVPRLGPGNTAAVALMIGEKAVDLILQQ